MSFVLRAARLDDLEAVYAMALATGGGLTNLPPDRASLTARLERTAACFARDEDSIADDLFLFMLENPQTGQISGTCQIFSKIGSQWPFYSYRLGALTQHSRELGRTFRAEMLTLSTDLDGSSEVGGLFLLPSERAHGAGALLARARYLFMRQHRSRFADRTIAELRGVVDDAGNSPFWDGLAGRFFGMSFHEADEFNGIHGNQFIADLMPKHPIYTAMLPDSARQALGKPHTSGRAALRMLEKEGFHFEHYVDIFDAGPTGSCATDDIATIRDARDSMVVALTGADTDAPQSIIATGRMADFRAGLGHVTDVEGGVALDAEAAARLGIGVGDLVTHIVR